MKLGVSGRVLKAVAMVVDTGDPGDGGDSKLVPNSSLFWGLVTAGGCESCNELALAERVGGLERALLGMCGVAWICVLLLVSPTTLGERLWGAFGEKRGVFSIF